jgi:secretion/DNA translocation related TadE-like protein
VRGGGGVAGRGVTGGDLGGERGSGSVLGLAIVACLFTLAATAFGAFSALPAKHAVQGAADSAALAAADAASGLVAGYPCDLAASAAALAGAALADCDLDGAEATVSATKQILGVTVSVSARAGPPPGAAHALDFAFPCDEHGVSDDWAAHVARGSAGGTDYVAPYGSEVRAMAGGVVTVTDSTTSGSGGRYVRIDHGPMGQYASVQTESLHLSEILVSVGQAVTRGEVIARSGASGFGSDHGYGPHLHISGLFDAANLDIQPYVVDDPPGG